MVIVFSILLLVMVLSPVSDVYHIMFIAPYIALVSVMACRVFRGVKLGYIKDADDGTGLIYSLRTHTAAVVTTDKSQYKTHNPAPSSHSFVVETIKTARFGEP
jgi:hypothetical protein